MIDLKESSSERMPARERLTHTDTHTNTQGHRERQRERSEK